MKGRMHNLRSRTGWLVVLLVALAGFALCLSSAKVPQATPPLRRNVQTRNSDRSLAIRSEAETSLAPDQFVEVATQAGIHFALTSGGPEKRYIIEAKGGGGIAWIDYDNDGFPDLFLVNGSTYEQWKRARARARACTTTTVTERLRMSQKRSGLDHTGWGMGVCVGDYDNDGFDDLYVTYYGGNVLYHNNGNGTFTDVTEKAGVRGHGWGMGCAFGDYDSDGRLDLYVANYLDDGYQPARRAGQRAELHLSRLRRRSAGRAGLEGGRDILFHNNGRRDIYRCHRARRASIRSKYYGLGVVWGDYDRDGRPDIYVANDSTPSSLYHNNGDGTFTDVGVEAGVAYSSEGQEQAGMGTDFADYDNDGWGDLVKGNFLRRHEESLPQQPRRNLHRCHLSRPGWATSVGSSQPSAPNSSTTTTTAGRTSSWRTARRFRRSTATRRASPTPSATCCSTTGATGSSMRWACARGRAWRSRR